MNTGRCLPTVQGYCLPSEIICILQDYPPRSDAQTPQPPKPMENGAQPKVQLSGALVDGLGINCIPESELKQEFGYHAWNTSSGEALPADQSTHCYGSFESCQPFKCNIETPTAAGCYREQAALSCSSSSIDDFDYSSTVDEANGHYNFTTPQFHTYEYCDLGDESMNAQSGTCWAQSGPIMEDPFQFSNGLQINMQNANTWIPPNSDWQSTYSQLEPAIQLVEPQQPQALDYEDTSCRRLSISSNAPSSVFSNESQSTPYFMTPSTTPMLTPRNPMESNYTPMSTHSSPGYRTHSTSPSAQSLKALTPKARSLRPAPYHADRSQQSRRSTGKSLSLPTRRSSPGALQERARALSCNFGKTSLGDDFGHNDRQSFDQNLHIIRQQSNNVMASMEDQTQYTFTHAQLHDFQYGSGSPQPLRQKLPQLKPKEQFPPSANAVPLDTIPPLYLPDRPSEPLSPPPADLQPSPDSRQARPKYNQPIFPNDAYTPKYSRGTKEDLEGWCGECQPGRWLNMKTSAYWYDKKFNHGINPRTKQAFVMPLGRRWTAGSSVIREGLCGCCGQWIVMDTCKTMWKKWYKHAYECQNKVHKRVCGPQQGRIGREDAIGIKEEKPYI